MILITRPVHAIGELTQMLAEVGLESFELPLTELRQAAPAGVERFCAELAVGDFLLFTSRNGVEMFWKLLPSTVQHRIVREARVAAIGESTGEALRERGVIPLERAEYGSSRDFGAAFLQQWATDAEKRAYLIQPDAADPALRKQLELAGWRVEQVAPYEVLPFLPDERRCDELRQRLKAGRIQAILLGSSEAARQLRTFSETHLSAEDGKRLLRCPVGAIGSATRETAERCGFSVRWMPEAPSFPGLIRMLAADPILTPPGNEPMRTG